MVSFGAEVFILQILIFLNDCELISSNKRKREQQNISQKFSDKSVNLDTKAKSKNVNLKYDFDNLAAHIR